MSEDENTATRFPIVPLIAGGLWLAATVAGFSLVAAYEWSATPVATGEIEFPETDALLLSSDSPALVLFLHPRCPCSPASLAELQRILARVTADVDVRLVFYQPSSADDQWADTALRRAAKSTPGAKIHADSDGRIARLYGARVSGETLIIARGGRLVFRGGITNGRGHEGGNAGADAALAWLSEQQGAARGFPVFGCPLFSSP